MKELDYVDAKAIGLRLGIGHRTVYRWAAAGAIPSRKMGVKLIRFSLSEVAEWMESGGLSRAIRPAGKVAKPKVQKRKRGQREPDLSVMGYRIQ